MFPQSVSVQQQDYKLSKPIRPNSKLGYKVLSEYCMSSCYGNGTYILDRHLFDTFYAKNI